MTYLEIAKTKFDNLKNKKDVLILSVESSCDETSIALVRNGREVLANIISTQIEIHKQFGGVVPEVASRNHIKNISTVLEEALAKAEVSLQDIDAIAVTYGAGLMGALLVGVNFAKTLAYALKLPLIAVSHVHGHIGANYISHKTLQPPFCCLMVSGGHTAIVRVEDYCDYHLIGSTVDDSVGECFDKVARVLGLSYPGGPNIDRLAREGKNVVKFNYKAPLQNTYNFSFSGLKTAVVNFVHNKEQKNEQFSKEDLAYSFQQLVVDELSGKTMNACRELGLDKLVVAGGVGANSWLRERLQSDCEREKIKLYLPDLKYCTDNAAMIGAIAYYYVLNGIGLADLTLTAKPTVNI
ncbi:MAG: tRNA (adenosine(37)-N6)-threonylcarbamoyltransferase complex transferase subunit TsaD [Clostridia bacterium]|nr:tRNA (adenosine(37)-N6)-threonylcarbamoyltransferase complex transferase subunit TsaD [Clostridia bacterium]